MSTKSRGINAERDLIRKFWAAGWAALRSAGSGAQQHPSPDVIAANNLRRLALEVKLTTKQRQYFTEQEVKELRDFAARFGAEPWLGVKFFREEWRFFSPESTEKTASHYVIPLATARARGLTFEELIA